MEEGVTIDPAITEVMSDLGIDAKNLDGAITDEAPVEEIKEEVASEEVADEVKEDGEPAENNEEASKIEGEEPSEDAPKEVTPEETAKIQEYETKIAEFQAQLQAKEASFMEEKAKWHEQLEASKEKVQIHDEIDSFLAHVAENDPDLYEVIQKEYQNHHKQYSNPVIDQLRKQQAELNKKLESFTAKASDEVTRTKLDSEVNQVKATIGKEAEAAGIKIDYQAVEDVWADNPKLSYEEALFAKYGAAIAKAKASKAKVEAVETKLKARPAVATVGTAKRSNVSADKDFSKLSYDESIMEIFSKVTGRSRV